MEKQNKTNDLKSGEKINRCQRTDCRKKLTLVELIAGKCRCNQFFCPKHRLAEAHACNYDYSAERRQVLVSNNPVMSPSRIR